MYDNSLESLLQQVNDYTGINTIQLVALGLFIVVLIMFNLLEENN